MSLSDQISQAFVAIKTHFRKILFVPIAFVFFSIVLFPFDDLGDLVTEKIATGTQNQVFLHFDHLGISFFPPSLKMKNVVVDTPFLPSLRAGSINLAPALGRLITFKRGVSVQAEDLFKGDYSGSFGEVSKDNRDMVEFNTSFRGVDLRALTQFFESPWEISGAADLYVERGLIDPEMVEQPKFEVEMRGEKVALPNTLPSNIPFLGGMLLPTMRFSEVSLKGRMINREMVIDLGVLGGENDPFRAKIKGKLEVEFRRGPGGIVPIMGGYDLSINLEMDRNFEADFQKRLPIAYDPLTKYKSVTGRGSRFALRVKSPNTYSIPEMTPGQVF